MKSIMNSLLLLKAMSEMSVIDDRNVDGSNKHPIKYRTRLFYIGHLTTISIYTSFRSKYFERYSRFDGSVHPLSSEQTISRWKVVVRHRENFRGFLMKVGGGSRRRPRPSLRFIPFSGPSISSSFSSRRHDAALSPLRRSISLPSLVPALSSNYENLSPAYGNTVTSG